MDEPAVRRRVGFEPSSGERPFANRHPEAASFRDAIAAVEAQLRRPSFGDIDELRNVLVFYGAPGIGKAELSRNLEAWAQGRDAQAAHWGEPPGGRALPVARWDLGGVQGGSLDIGASLVSIRAAIATTQNAWPAFTLAATAYWTGVNPGVPFPVSRVNTQSRQVADVLGSLAPDLAAAATDLVGIAGDLVLPGGVSSLSATGVRSIVRRVLATLHTNRQLNRFESLRGVLQRCQNLRPGGRDPELAADILWLLTEEVEAAPPEARPLLVLFMDQFDKVQAAGSMQLERVIQRMIASLPWALVVVTGRDRLDWDVTREGLALPGAAWPLLSRSATEEPHQHELRPLSRDDTLAYLQRRAASEKWALDAATSTALLDRVADSTAGWPLHVDAVCNVAALRSRELAPEGRFLGEPDLIDNLPGMVRRMFDLFTGEEALITNAACLLPFFDLDLVAAVAGTSRAAVDASGLVARFSENPNPRYPFRVHPELRRLVRRAGPEVRGGWADPDWKAAAQRCLAEARRRHDAALDAIETADGAGPTGDDAALLDAIVLGLTVAAVEDVFDPWLVEAIRTAPTMQGLSARLPAVPASGGSRDAWSVIEQIHALALPTAAGAEALRRIYDGGRAAARSAGLWNAYRLRALNRFPETIAQLEDLAATPGGSSRQYEIYRNQLSVTLRMQRQFRDALAYRQAEGLPDARFREWVERHHGLHHHSPQIERDHIANQPSLRYRLELQASFLVVQVRSGTDCSAEARDVLRRLTDLGEPGYAASCLLALGLLHLRVPEVFEEIILGLESRERHLPPSGRIPHLLAMRAVDSGAEVDRERAIGAVADLPSFRGADWIPTEFLFEQLGHPLDPVEPSAQWVLPFDDVKRAWSDVVQTVRSLAARVADDRSASATEKDGFNPG